MNLFINYYSAGNRQDEIDFCLSQNAKNKLIKRIIVFNEHEIPPSGSKFKIKPTTQRPTYQEFFNEMKNYPNDINILANADIYFDDTLKKAEILTANKCYAITRWEYIDGNPVSFDNANGVNGACPSHFSQDVWVFRGGPKVNNCHVVVAYNERMRKHENIPFNLGVPGCDNIIAVRLKAAYQVINPANDIKCIHVHKDSRRQNYTHRIVGSHGGRWGQVQQGRVPIKSL